MNNSSVVGALGITRLIYFRALNGSATDAHWMMGNTLNPNSNMVKEMSVALEAESKMHGAAVGDTKNFRETTGVPFPKRRRVRLRNTNLPGHISPFHLIFSPPQPRTPPRVIPWHRVERTSRRRWTSCSRGNGSRAASSSWSKPATSTVSSIFA